jgi:hypothetical protein
MSNITPRVGDLILFVSVHGNNRLGVVTRPMTASELTAQGLAGPGWRVVDPTPNYGAVCAVTADRIVSLYNSHRSASHDNLDPFLASPYDTADFND